MPKQIGARAILNKSKKIGQMNDLQKKVGDWGQADKKKNTSTKYEKRNQSFQKDDKSQGSKNSDKRNPEHGKSDSRKYESRKTEQGKLDSKKFESRKTEQGKSDSRKFESIKPEHGKSDSRKFESKRSEQGKQDSRKFVTRKSDQDKYNQKKSNQGEKNKKSDMKPACPYYEKCGGCQLQNMTYEGQLKWKQKQVEDSLRKFGPIDKIIGTKQPYNYRNKVQVVMDFDRRGNVLSGIFQRDTFKVLPIDTCLTQDKKSDDIIKTIRELAKSFKYKIYADDTEYGLLRHIVIKRGIVTGEIMVVLVLTSPILPSKNNFVQALRKKHPEITSIIININDKKTNTVLGDRKKLFMVKAILRMCYADIDLGFLLNPIIK